jgi:hypothetical protein
MTARYAVLMEYGMETPQIPISRRVYTLIYLLSRGVNYRQNAPKLAATKKPHGSSRICRGLEL